MKSKFDKKVEDLQTKFIFDKPTKAPKIFVKPGEKSKEWFKKIHAVIDNAPDPEEKCSTCSDQIPLPPPALKKKSVQPDFFKRSLLDMYADVLAEIEAKKKKSGL